MTDTADKPNVIFLDFDGVICTHRASIASGESEYGGGLSYLDPIALGLVKRLCEDYNAKIVVSSSWRTDYNLMTMMSLLGAACPGLGHHVWQHQSYWRTNDLCWMTKREDESDRGAEIDQWLHHMQFEINRYVILDDMADMRPHQDALVKTDTYEGFGFWAYRKACAILEGRKPGWQPEGDAMVLRDEYGDVRARFGPCD